MNYSKKRSIGDAESRVLRFLVEYGEEELQGIVDIVGENVNVDQRAVVVQRTVDALDALALYGFVEVFWRESAQGFKPIDVPTAQVRDAVQEAATEMTWIESSGRWGMPHGCRGERRYLAAESTSKGREFLEKH